MARVPDEPFELAVREPQATTKGILRLLPREAPPPDRVVSLDTWTSASSARIEPPNDAELRELALYEGLRALDRASWSTDDPLKLLATLPDDTRDDIAAIARRCAPWLSRIAETRRRRHGAVNR